MVHNPNAFRLKCDIKISFTYGNETENLPIIIYALTVNGTKTEINKTENGYYVNDVVINKNAKILLCLRGNGSLMARAMRKTPKRDGRAKNTSAEFL